MSQLQVETFDNAPSRTVLTGLVVSREVLARLSPAWDGNLFASPPENALAQLCLDYFRRYDRPPGPDIEPLFRQYAETHQDAATSQLMESLLASLSDDYEGLGAAFNHEYAVDAAGRLFNEVRLRRLRDAIDYDLATGGAEAALARVNDFRRLQVGAGGWVDPLRDEAVMAEVEDSEADVLVRFPGAAGPFYGDAFCRDAFVAYVGVEKRGKSFHLFDVGWRALLQRRRVAYIQAGDMSRRQVLRRFYARACRRPVKPRFVRWPTAISKEPLGVTHEERHYDEPLSVEEVRSACRRVVRGALKTDEPLLRLLCYPNKSLTVPQLRNTLRDWSRGGWHADVVVVDYADVLAPSGGREEFRHQIDDAWSLLRSLSQELHCCVVTASQATKAAYTAELLSLEHNSEDKRKAGHVTAMYGINQTSGERTAGVFRINEMCNREGDNDTGRQLLTAPCLAVANPCVLSTL